MSEKDKVGVGLRRVIIKPCPFCKNRPTPLLNDKTDGLSYSIYCCYLAFGEFRTIKELINEWNKRAL